jgi:hypothetical protein
METSAILTIGLLGIWCSLCVDDKDKSDQRMLGYALGFGLLFILVCKDLYSEDDCSRYEYLDDENERNTLAYQAQVQEKVESDWFKPWMEWLLLLVPFLSVLGWLFRRYCTEAGRKDGEGDDALDLKLDVEARDKARAALIKHRILSDDSQ